MRTAGRPRDRRRPARWWIPAALIALAAVVRMAALDHEGLWCDEAYTYLTVSTGPSELVDALRNDDAPPLFYLLLHGARRGFSSLGWDPGPEAAVRLFPALFSLAMVVAAGLRLRGRAHGWPSVVLLAFLSFSIFYARQGRSYSWVMLCVLAVIFLAQDVAARGRRAPAAFLALSLGLLLWSHNLGFLVWTAGCASFSVLLAAARKNGRSLRPAILGLAAHGAGLLLVLPWHLSGANQLAYHARTNQWMAQYWERVPLALAPLLSLVAFGPGSPVRPAPPANLPQPSTPEGWVLCVLATALLLGGCLVGLVRARPAPETDGRRWRSDTALEASYLFVPLLLSLAASMLWSPTYVLGRTDTLVFAPFALLAGRALSRLRARWRRGILWTCALVSIAVILPLLGIGSSARLKGHDRALARRLAQELGPRDLIVHTLLTAPSLEAYLRAWGIGHQVTYYPPSVARNWASTWGFSLDSLAVYREDALRLRRRLDGVKVERIFIPVRLRPGVRPQARNTAEDLVYPQSVLAFLLGGMDPLPVHVSRSHGGADTLRYRQDWVAGERMIVSYRREDLVDLESLGEIEVKP